MPAVPNSWRKRVEAAKKAQAEAAKPKPKKKKSPKAVKAEG